MENELINQPDNIPPLQSPFEQLCELDIEGKEWWNSRELARILGYGRYWNFERVIAKAQAWVTQKDIIYHLIRIENGGTPFVRYCQKYFLPPDK